VLSLTTQTFKTIAMQATANIYIQKRESKRTASNLCPVKLCITYKRVRKYYSIKEKIKNHEWLYLSLSDAESLKKPKGKFKDKAIEYKRIVDDAIDIINDIEVFSFNQFEDKYFVQTASWDNFFAAMWEHIQNLKNDNRFGYASSFESTLRAVKEFHTGKKFSFNNRKDKVEKRASLYLKGKELRFVDITKTWLKKFEQYLIKEGKSKSTRGIYLRNLKVLFNVAINEHNIQAKNPFTNFKISTSENTKKALSMEQISLIANYETKHPQQRFYRDIFMFSFLAYGMNLADIARLKYSNISDNKLTYIREKTRNEEQTETTISVPITSQMQAIIDRYGNKTIGYDAFVFPILNPKWNAERIYAEIKQLTKQVNKYIRQVAINVGIKENVSSYYARHSWATISKNTGKTVDFISESLGHSSTAVTKRYLDSFEDKTKREHSETLENLIFNQNAG